MKIEFIAFESFGVRSQATYIETNDVRIFIDPSAALAPRRFGLPPHRVEVERLFKLFDRIAEKLEKVDVVIITHYHYDHHDPARFLDPELYRDKIVLVKHPTTNINVSQKIRAARFLKILEPVVREIRYADGLELYFGDTRIVFSQPVPHGENARLGYVLEVCIDDGKTRFLYSSDVEGVPLDEQLEFFYICRPTIAVVDGPPTYLVGYKYSTNSFRRSLENLAKILRIEELQILILDHHLTREISYKDRLSELYDLATNLGKKVLTAAEFMGLQPEFLEARRRELYAENPEDGLALLKSRKPDLKPEDLGE